MVLTDPAHRRRGFARRLMEHLIEALAERQVDWIKLDATEAGAPLYREFGFEAECAVERWGSVAAQVRGMPSLSWPGWRLGLDREAFGADRAQLLGMLAPLGAAAVGDEGYAMARPGSKAAYFGPCISRGPEAAVELLTWFLAGHRGEPVYWDLLPSNVEAVRLARAGGFAPQRRLVRMARRGRPGAAPLDHDDSQAFAIAGFEFG